MVLSSHDPTFLTSTFSLISKYVRFLEHTNTFEHHRKRFFPIPSRHDSQNIELLKDHGNLKVFNQKIEASCLKPPRFSFHTLIWEKGTKHYIFILIVSN